MIYACPRCDDLHADNVELALRLKLALFGEVDGPIADHLLWAVNNPMAVRNHEGMGAARERADG